MGFFLVIRLSEGVSSNSSTEKLSMSHSTLARDPAIDQYQYYRKISVSMYFLELPQAQEEDLCVFIGHFFLQLSHLRLGMFEDDD